MKAIETTATVSDTGQLSLDEPLEINANRRVRVIVLISEDENEEDPDDTPDEIIIEGIRQGLREALSGQTLPLSQIWDGIDAE